MGKQLATRTEDHAVPIEDQLVLASDQVYVCHVGAVVGGASGDHLFARRALARVIRRPVDVDQELSAVVRLPRHRTGWIPAVLAYRHTDPDARDLEDRAAVAR